MRRTTGAPFSRTEASRIVGQGNASHLDTLGKIHDRESVETGELNKNAARGSIGICFKGHWANAAVKLYLPRDVIRREVNNCC